MSKIAIISANLGQCSVTPKEHILQKCGDGSKVDFYNFTDVNFPPRSRAMLPRLQAKIPKMYGPELVEGCDYYIWLDSTFTIVREDFTQWFLNELGTLDMAFFSQHDGRTSIEQELNFMLQYSRDLYLKDRYEDEPLEQQVAFYIKDPFFKDCLLLSGGAFLYKNTVQVRTVLSDWFTQCARWTVQDQLSLPYVLSKHPEVTKIKLRENLLENKYLKHKFETTEEKGMSNFHKWDDFYKSLSSIPSSFVYGDTHTYKLGADFLSDCYTVEDWGTGGGGFKRFRINAIGVDGSSTPHADKIADLETYTSEVDGIFMRHVLEHNHAWVKIFKNALQSIKKKMVLVIFTPMTEGDTFELSEGTAENRSYGIDVPNLSLSTITIQHLIHLHDCKSDATRYKTDTKYGEETVYLISKRK